MQNTTLLFSSIKTLIALAFYDFRTPRLDDIYVVVNALKPYETPAMRESQGRFRHIPASICV